MIGERTDPERWKDLADRKHRRDAEFLKGQITETVYLVSLRGYGFLPNEAKSELGALIADKKALRHL